MNMQKLVSGGIVILLIFVIVNAFFVMNINQKIGERFSECHKLIKPLKVSLTVIPSTCTDCFSADNVVNAIKESQRLEITGESKTSRNSNDAKGIISKYSIKKLPAIILQGDIEKISVQGFKKINDALVFDGVTAPYQDAVTGDVKGKVSLILINAKQCEQCPDMAKAIENVKKAGMHVAEQQELDFADAQAKEIIKKYDIKKVPAFLLSQEVEAYPSLAQSLQQTQVPIKEGYYVIESTTPYVDTATGKTRGLISLLLLADSSCAECYDVNIHKQIFGRMGLAIADEKNVDISSEEGKELVKKYQILKAPTSILTGDIDSYDFFKQIWSQAGSVESDGAYVFRHLSVLGPGVKYKDLKDGKIVENPQPQPNEQQAGQTQQ